MRKIELLKLCESDIDYIYDNWIGQNAMLGQTTLNNVASKNELKELINLWNTKSHNGKYFEVFKIVGDECIVGLISLYELEETSISIGCTIDKKFWHKGYGSFAVMLAIEKSKEKKYKMIKTQCLTSNFSSVNLHKKCGFTFIETKVNSKGNLNNFYSIKLN